ncbi:maltose permease MAL61 [Apiospora phragmitis]|uniref:Maltose permease MAL61 n=1 Tax=Apiospora phragmitis TaxID=2905665 RepID=A0ABR1VCF9_9PEZI
MLFAFQLTLGPICYCIAAEIPSTRLRIKTVALSRASYNTAAFVNNAIMPKMVGKNDWNWGAKGGFLWAGVAFVFLVWTWFRLPESRGLAYSELDLLFEHGLGRASSRGRRPGCSNLRWRMWRFSRIGSGMNWSTWRRRCRVWDLYSTQIEEDYLTYHDIVIQD